MWQTLGIAVLYVLGLASGVGCRRPSPSPPAAPLQPSKLTALTTRTVESDMTTDSLAQRVQGAEQIFVGRPVQRLKSPHIWAGMYASYQGVRYQVVRVLKGDAFKVGSEARVLHPLVQGAPTIEPQEPELLASLFDPSRELLVFTKKRNDKMYCISEIDGVIPVSDALLAQVSALVSEETKKK